VSQLVEALRCEVAGSISDEVLPVGLCPWGGGGDSASKKNKYQEHFLGNKCGRGVWLAILPTYFMCQLPRNRGSSTAWAKNACTRIALSFLLLQHVLELHSLTLKMEAGCSAEMVENSSSRPVFLNGWALASIIPARERFSWNLSF